MHNISACVVHITDQVIIVDVAETTMVRFAFVHGARSYVQRRQLWADLLNFSSTHMVVLGDFNALKGAHERRGSVPPSLPCKDFCNFINESGWIEPFMAGNRFTWSGRRFFPKHIESVLDRVLYSQDFSNLWSNINCLALSRCTSDHSPIIMQCSTTAVRHDCFLPFVADNWKAQLDCRCPIRLVMLKLKRLKGALKVWNRDIFGHVDMKIAELEDRLLKLQDQIKNEGYSNDLFDQEVTTQADLCEVLNRKHDMARQQSRADWLKDGDRNTNFFHGMMRKRREKHNIKLPRIDGSHCTDTQIIEKHIVD